MSGKKWLLGACGGILLTGAWGTNNAGASLLIDLQIASENGAPARDPKFISFFARTGDVEHINIYATVRGRNTTTTNDGFQSLQGSIKSIAYASGPRGVYIGNVITPAGDDILDDNGDPTGQKFFGSDPFSGNGMQNGRNQDLKPKDENLDWGGEPTNDTGTGDFVTFRAASMQKNNIGVEIDKGLPNAGRRFLIGSFDLVVGQNVCGGDSTEINFYPRLLTDGSKAQGTALWQEDSSSGAKDGLSGDLIVGAPVEFFADCPEPSSLATLGLAAAGLLARRRRS